MLTLAVAPSASADQSGCPDLSGKLPSSIVTASYTTSAGTASYLFGSVNRNPVDGVPGLIEYFVYTSPLPDSETPTVNGANGQAWTATGSGGSCFSFQRPDGNPSNVPLDGTQNVQIGTATWNGGTVPSNPTLLLHINDSAECGRLYGAGTSTCFVLPGGRPQATVNVCKFHDENSSGLVDGQTLLDGWVIDGMGVLNGSGLTDSVAGTTGQTGSAPGCVTFNVAGDNLDGSIHAITFEEVLKNGWEQTAAYSTCTYTSGIDAATGSVLVTLTPPLAQNGVCNVYFGNVQQEEEGVVTVTKSALTPPILWNITKAVDSDKQNVPAGSGATFNYTVTVTHTDPGSLLLTGVITLHSTTARTNLQVFETPSPAATCTITDPNPSSSATPGNPLTGLAIPADTDYPLSYSCAFASIPSGAGTNTVEVQDDQGHSLATDLEGFSFYPTTVTVVDTLGGTLGTVSVDDPSPAVFTYPKTFTDPAGTCTTHDNTASVTTIKPDTGAPVTLGSDGKSVKVCVGADLAVSKTASPAFRRTFAWGITKAVDKTFVEQLGGSVTFNYTVGVTHDAGTDSDWTVTGTITVTNPNDWEDIAANLSDAVNDGGTCTVTPLSGPVPAKQSLSTGYTCTYSSAPSPLAGTNIATATWDATASATPDSSSTGSAPFDFGAASPTLVDNCVAVTDPLKVGGSLGMACSTDASPKKFTYSNTVNVPVDTCTTVNNTATFTTNSTGTTGSASQSVQVCGPVAGGLTMGFWQNKNGQGIITGSGPASGTCNLTAWLRGYAPFQDLSSTATCAQVGTYVTNVIKAANASGAAMNAMLKAQDLATSLDVYFSDPAHNAIKAPAAIGPVFVDLTHICKMIDGGGSGSCSGAYQNVSAAFGGATCLSVQSMLSYAASQSNAGGSTWYAQVKATQEMAKNAFDAINNQAAFSCTP